MNVSWVNEPSSTLEATIPRDCHGLLYPAGYSRQVQQGTGMGWVSPTRAIPVPPAGGWRVGPHIQTPREINPNDARRIVWALCRYVFIPFFSRFFQTNSYFVFYLSFMYGLNRRRGFGWAAREKKGPN